jgi:hypothetical protein
MARDIVFTPTDDEFLNPERGMMAYTKMNDSTLGAIDTLRDRGHTLMWGLIDLEPWRETDLSQSRLQEIGRSFDRARQNGLKLIVRILYTEAQNDPDTTLAWQFRHLDQLAPLFFANDDIILTYQAGGIGSWGEWYYSSTGLDNPTDRKALLDGMFSRLPEETFIQVRTPMYKQAYADIVGTNPDWVNRLGHYNDCFMANDTDFGTYLENPSIQFWKDSVSADKLLAPLGGETCNPHPRSDCPNPVEETEELGWTFMNSVYNTEVLDKWESQGCFDEVRRRLGYRFVLKSATIPDEIVRGSTFSIDVKLTNEGFAPLYKPRTVYVRLVDGARTFEWPIETVDPRDWEPGGVEFTVSATIQVPVILSGNDVDLSLWMPDSSSSLRMRSEYSIRFANTSVWNESRGDNNLASVIPVVNPSTSAFILSGD